MDSETDGDHLKRRVQSFEGFLRELDGITFGLDHVLEFITSIERKKYPKYENPILIYLGIDEYQNLTNEALIYWKAYVQQRAISFGTVFYGN
jgi:hypothetical protein